MNPRELMLAQIRHEETHPIPYVLGFEGDIELRLDRHYGGPAWRQRVKTFVAYAGMVDTMRKTPVPGRDGVFVDLYGSTWRMDQRPFRLETPGLTRPSFDGCRWPRPEEFCCAPADVENSRQGAARMKKDFLVMAGLGWGLFEMSWGIRGFENVLMDVIAEEDFYEELLERITVQFLAWVDLTCTNVPDIDAIFFGDDWGDQRGVIIGPERWRRFMKPRWARIYERVHSHGKLAVTHCCGSIVDIIPDVIEIGLDVLESVQPEARGMNPYGLKKRWGDKLVFWGGLGTQSTIPFGTPAQIHAEVKRLCREMGKGGGYILAPAKALQPETPTENAVAVFEAFVDQE